MLITSIIIGKLVHTAAGAIAAHSTMASAGGGAALGAGASAVIGEIGVAIGGTAIGIGTGGMAVLGAITVLAAKAVVAAV
jgi:hypothetical protein